ncbi:prolow-density lipoprotein receptor-related protein 1-like [Saccoglossus kowalevskii]
MVLTEDNKNCMFSDEDFCSMKGRCSQICVKTKGNRGPYYCDCYQGYQLEPDNWSCRSTDPGVPYLIFSNRYELRFLDIRHTSGSYSSLITNLRNSIALDAHYAKRLVFWTDVVDDKIYRGMITPDEDNAGLINVEPVVETGLATTEGLAVDWIADNIYWVESNLDQIEVARINGTMRTTLIAGNMESPRAIALDPRDGLLFWTDWDSGQPRIERASMAGENRIIVMNVTDLQGGWPNGLTIDFLERRIIWIDARSNSIHSSFYDGSDVHTILKGHEHLSHPFAVSLFEGFVFWTDWKSNIVVKANKWTGGNVTVVHNTNSQPFDLQVYHSTRQPPSTNPCVHNGGCSHLCIIGLHGNTAVCKCPHLTKLADDKKTCVSNEKFVLFTRQTELRGVDLKNGFYSVIPALTVPELENATAVDYDAREKRIYWTDVKLNAIKRVFINGTGIESIVSGVSNPHGLAIDWISRNIYWTSYDNSKKAINVAKLDKTYRNSIVTGDLDHPSAIAVNPREGKIFWINNGESPKIEAANMDGTNRVAIIEGLQKPGGLAIDLNLNKLYYTDAGDQSIHASDFNGENAQIIFTPSPTSQPWGIAVTDDKIYWSEKNSEEIMYVDKTNPGVQTVLRNRSPNVMDIVVYDEQTQNAEIVNACYDNNGDCQQLCLPTSASERVCKCTAGFTIDDGETICRGIASFLLYSMDTGIYGISLDLVDTVDVLTPITGLTLAVAVDFDAAKDYIYWTDTMKNTIHRIKRDMTQKEDLLTNALGRVEGIAVDWIARE